ncbi:hypothetical protein NQ317_002718 [Molorchus minor]|uniref:ethanolamine kinase n=1 Tax=Molorchus minor TaxID=1323400 RepID=A0ABQ9K5J3_9CUCU|nr:hypothetical protein NQ317_002718 [Molorchus minor]
MTERNQVPHLKITVDENEVEKGAIQILETIRPTWEKASIRFRLLTDGMTNKLVGCKPEDADDAETVLVRIYGNKTDLLINRKDETRNILLLNSVGLAPALYATFENGLAYRFIPGRTLDMESVRDPNIYKLVATRMAKLHKVKVDGISTGKSFLWDKMQSFLHLVPDTFSDSEKNKRYQETLIEKSKIAEEIMDLKRHLENLDSPIVFAHNDLLLGNVIFTETDNSVTFIDYEYAISNYQAYDIANHFAEFVGFSLDLDYSKYPEKDLQVEWLTTYLTEYNGNVPTEEDVDRLYVQVNKFVLASHILWGLWALIQAEHSYIDFDFMQYANLRFREYFAKKDQHLSLKISSR